MRRSVAAAELAEDLAEQLAVAAAADPAAATEPLLTVVARPRADPSCVTRLPTQARRYTSPPSQTALQAAAAAWTDLATAHRTRAADAEASFG